MCLGKLYMCDSLKLFFVETMTALCCCLCAPESARDYKDKRRRWFRLGSDRLEQDLDIVKLLRDLQELKQVTHEQRKATSTI